MLKNDISGIPKICFGCVDVRDVAKAEVAAIIREDETNGKRYLLSGESLWMGVTNFYY